MLSFYKNKHNKRCFSKTIVRDVQEKYIKRRKYFAKNTQDIGGKSFEKPSYEALCDKRDKYVKKVTINHDYLELIRMSKAGEVIPERLGKLLTGCIERHNLGFIEVLLIHGLNPNSPVCNLHSAIERNDIEYIMLLLSYGLHLRHAFRHFPQSSKRDPYYCFQRFPTMFRQTDYYHFVQVIETTVFGQMWSPIAIAVERQHLDILKLLISEGDRDGNSLACDNDVLGIALRIKNHVARFKVVKCLITSGCIINPPNKDLLFLSFLFTHVVDWNTSVTQLLIQHGCKVDGYDVHLFLRRQFETLRPQNVMSPTSPCIPYSDIRCLYDGGMKFPRAWVDILPAVYGQYTKDFDLFSDVQPLTKLCRRTIRQCLIQTGNGTSIGFKVKELCIPTALKSFLMLIEYKH